MKPGPAIATAAVIAAVAISLPGAAAGERGLASTYNDHDVFCDKETFDAKALTAAHRTLACGSLVKVTNLENGRSVVVRINDRGPCNTKKCKLDHPEYADRVIDLTPEAARRIGSDGMIQVELEPVQGFEDRWKLVADAFAGLAGYPRTAETAKARPAPTRRAAGRHQRKKKTTVPRFSVARLAASFGR